VTVAVVVDEHPLPANAVMVKVVVMAAEVRFVRVPAMLVPLPLAGIPVRLLVLFLAQVKVVPGRLFGFEIVMVLIGLPEHNVCAAGVTLMVGFSRMMKLVAVRQSGATGHSAKYIQVPGVLVFGNPEPATPTGLKGEPVPMGVPPVDTVYQVNPAK
jgi:hypothetical protein